MLEQLQPKEIFRWFEELSKIPRGSGNTEQVSQWCLSQITAMGLICKRDEVGNVYAYKAASPGYEGAKPVLLQGHVDMVCVSAPGACRDMAREGVELCTDGKRLWADGTTLGADNGIGVAMLLALLEGKCDGHPPLEVLLTVDEETGMDGALNVHPEWLRAKRMINLDAEKEGVLWAGCSGGNTALITLQGSMARHTGESVRIEIGGLAGGHSGIDILKHRANAILLLGRTLQALQERGDLRLLQAGSPGPSNAIPSKAEAKILIASEASAVSEEVSRIQEVFRQEYGAAEPNLYVRAEFQGRRAEYPALDRQSTDRAIDLLTSAPNGVQAMSEDFPDMPLISLNFGQLMLDGKTLEAGFCLRSNAAYGVEILSQRLTAITEQLGGRISFSTGHAAWEYTRESPLRKLLACVYQRVAGKAPSVKVTHGGAECGVLLEKIPGMDCVSIGPDMQGVHTPNETLDAGSTERTWRFLQEILKDMKE